MSSYVTRNEASVDTVVAVAGQHFVAHRDVLVEHSGYFRGALLMTTGGLMVSPFQTVIVSSLVSPRTFAVLLDFMYSSRLRLDADVADVLRCAQLLDMPKVVDLCREYILRAEYEHPLSSHQQQPMARAFPTRLWLPPPAPPPMFAHSHQASLLSIPSTSTGTSSSIRVIRPIASRQPLPSQQQSYDFRLSCGSVAEQQQPHRSEEGRALDEQCQSHWTSSPEDRHQQQQRPASASSESWISVVDSDGQSAFICKENEDDEAIVEDSPTPSSMSPSSVSEKLEQKQKEEPEDAELKKVAIVDVAYCDGPVKFQRILNDNCDLVMVLQTTIVQCSKSKQRGKGVVVKKPDDEPSKKSKSRRGQVGAAESKEDDVQGGGSSALTFCVHCKHTFKSRYCYMKHKRRHLNPLTVQDKCVESSKLAATSKDKSEAEEAAPSVVGWPVESGGNQSSDEQNSKKLLEINSTFYPCKLCGSKFPSYYFLHKHQRIFHASASASADGLNAQSTQPAEAEATETKP